MLLNWEERRAASFSTEWLMVTSGEFFNFFGIYVLFHSRYTHWKTPQIGLLNYAKCHFLWDDSKFAHNKVKTICIQPWVPPFSSHNYMVVIRTVKLPIPQPAWQKPRFISAALSHNYFYLFLFNRKWAIFLQEIVELEEQPAGSDTGNCSCQTIKTKKNM